MSALRSAFVLALLVLLAAPASRAAEDVPRTLAFQGRLVRADGTPENTPQDLTFSLYATPAGGSPLWQERLPSVQVTNGYYAVVLGSVQPLRYELTEGSSLFLGVAGTYRQNDSVDVVFTVGGRRHVAARLPIVADTED